MTLSSAWLQRLAKWPAGALVTLDVLLQQAPEDSVRDMARELLELRAEIERLRAELQAATDRAAGLAAERDSERQNFNLLSVRCAAAEKDANRFLAERDGARAALLPMPEVDIDGLLEELIECAYVFAEDPGEDGSPQEKAETDALRAVQWAVAWLRAERDDARAALRSLVVAVREVPVAIAGHAKLGEALAAAERAGGPA